MYFGANFSYYPINWIQYCIKYVVNFAHNRVIGLVINSAYGFQKYKKLKSRSK